MARSYFVIAANTGVVDIFHRKDHAILAIFRVFDTKGQAVTEGQDRAQVEHTLRHALEVEIFEFASLLEEARHKIQHRRLEELEFPAGIAIDNKAHPAYTLVQIEAPDRVR